MTDLKARLDRSQHISGAAMRVYAKRVQPARQRYQDSVERAQREAKTHLVASPLDLWRDWSAYAVDAAQRSVLYWDTLRQRGNQWLANERAGKPPVLHFDYGTVLDARKFERPANYALLRITPPKGVKVDPKRRPYVIIDPRAGHGPGIGGFKDDSQVGVALEAGHPVYFVMFFADPEPGQTLLDVTAAERDFIAEVRRRHPQAPKPAIVGNCQGGWAAMMLAASDPDSTGPLVINGAPMSYWGGAWNEGEGDNPMRYSGGLLGGTWLSSFTADLAGGIFDGAHLVQNFENLNPANTFFDKAYHLYANVDTEPPRFLDFERWWGGYYLMNREEIEWITQNLFVGNNLPVIVEGGEPVRATFDLGNGAQVLVSQAFAVRRGFFADGREVSHESGGGLGGAADRAVIVLRSLDLAGHRFENVEAAVDPQDTASDVNIGVSLLRSFILTTDFSRHRVWLLERKGRAAGKRIRRAA